MQPGISGLLSPRCLARRRCSSAQHCWTTWGELSCQRAHLRSSDTRSQGARIAGLTVPQPARAAPSASPPPPAVPGWPWRWDPHSPRHGWRSFWPDLRISAWRGSLRSCLLLGWWWRSWRSGCCPPDCPATYFKQHLRKQSLFQAQCNREAANVRGWPSLWREPDVEMRLYFTKNFVTRGTVISLYSHQSTKCLWNSIIMEKWQREWVFILACLGIIVTLLSEVRYAVFG